MLSLNASVASTRSTKSYLFWNFAFAIQKKPFEMSNPTKKEDKTAKLLAEVETVTGIMHSSVVKMGNNLVAMEDLDGKAGNHLHFDEQLQQILQNRQRN